MLHRVSVCCPRPDPHSGTRQAVPLNNDCTRSLPSWHNQGETAGGGCSATVGEAGSGGAAGGRTRWAGEFESIDAYRSFVAAVVARHSPERAEVERRALRPLPSERAQDRRETRVRVTRSGGFTLGKVFYTLPSRMIGHVLEPQDPSLQGRLSAAREQLRQANLGDNGVHLKLRRNKVHHFLWDRRRKRIDPHRTDRFEQGI